MAFAQFALRHHQQPRLPRRGAQQRRAPLGIALLERRPPPAQPREQALRRQLGVPSEIVPFAVLVDPRVDQLAMRACADGPTAARSTSQENECSRAVKWRDGWRRAPRQRRARPAAARRRCARAACRSRARARHRRRADRRPRRRCGRAWLRPGACDETDWRAMCSLDGARPSRPAGGGRPRVNSAGARNRAMFVGVRGRIAAEHGGAGDKRGRARGDHARRGLGVHAAIDFENDVAPARVDALARPLRSSAARFR